jgi:hypothetical protein
MMSVKSLLAATLCLAVLPVAANAAGLDCKEPAGGKDWPVAMTDIQAKLPKGDVLDDPIQLGESVAVLRDAGVSTPLILDYLIAAYCPMVAAEQGLTDAQKTEKMRIFARNLTDVVYQFADETSVIIDVPFSPDTMVQIREKAAAAKQPVATWVRETVAKSLAN